MLDEKIMTELKDMLIRSIYGWQKLVFDIQQKMEKNNEVPEEDMSTEIKVCTELAQSLFKLLPQGIDALVASQEPNQIVSNTTALIRAIASMPPISEEQYNSLIAPTFKEIGENGEFTEETNAFWKQIIAEGSMEIDQKQIEMLTGIPLNPNNYRLDIDEPEMKNDDELDSTCEEQIKRIMDSKASERDKLRMTTSLGHIYSYYHAINKGLYKPVEDEEMQR